MTFRKNNIPMTYTAFAEIKKQIKKHAIKQLYVLEYSPTQDAMNILTFEEMIQRNSKATRTDRYSNYIPIEYSYNRCILNFRYKMFRKRIDWRKKWKEKKTERFSLLNHTPNYNKTKEGDICQ